MINVYNENNEVVVKYKGTRREILNELEILIKELSEDLLKEDITKIVIKSIKRGGINND